MDGMIPWLILSHKRNLEIKEKEGKRDSHILGLRKERRKLPLLDHTFNAPKRGR